MYVYIHCSDEGVDKRLEAAIINDEIDLKLGFERYKDPQEKIGWLVNLHPVSSSTKCGTSSAYYSSLSLLKNSPLTFIYVTFFLIIHGYFNYYLCVYIYLLYIITIRKFNLLYVCIFKHMYQLF